MKEQAETMELEIGKLAPVFSADASSRKSVSLSDFRGSWVILYFYPRNNTPGCTREACAFRDSLKLTSDLNAVILGCSPDNVQSHEKFISKYDLPFVLLSDAEHTIALKYGVWKEKNLYGKKSMGIERSTFLIDPDGKLRRTWRRVKVDGHVDAVIDELKSMLA